VRIEGPRGTFVLDEESHRPLVFVAGDSGFAPIKSLIEHALALEAAESLALYRIAGARDGHYLDNLCRSWSDALDDFRYVPLTIEDGWSSEAVERALAQVLKQEPGLAGCDVYVAGPAPLALGAEFQLLEHGVPRAQLLVSPLES
jgi:CDP-4-dehydro-6-deoxyglucose reductase